MFAGSLTPTIKTSSPSFSNLSTQFQSSPLQIDSRATHSFQGKLFDDPKGLSMSLESFRGLRRSFSQKFIQKRASFSSKVHYHWSSRGNNIKSLPRHHQLENLGKVSENSGENGDKRFQSSNPSFFSFELYPAYQDLALPGWMPKDHRSAYPHPSILQQDADVDFHSPDNFLASPSAHDSRSDFLWLENLPSKKIFSNSSGGEIRCRVAGDEATNIEWRFDDGREIPEVS